MFSLIFTIDDDLVHLNSLSNKSFNKKLRIKNNLQLLYIHIKKINEEIRTTKKTDVKNLY